MSISFINIFSSNFNPCNIVPEVKISNRNISIFPAEIFSDGYNFTLDERIDVSLPNLEQKSNLRIHLVEEISTKDLIVVTDLNPEGFPEWEPDSNTHRIIHNLIYGNIIPGDYPLENSIIEIYLKNPPKN